MRIIVELLVQQKLSDLLEALLDKGYFATEERALAYVRDIRKIISSIQQRTARKTKNNYYGEYYVTYKANRRTTWYITFDMDNDRYVVRNLVNNHTEDYPNFIKRL